MRLNNPSQKKRDYEQVEKGKIVESLPAKKLEIIIEGSPIWIIFMGRMKIAHLLPEHSVCQENHLFSNLKKNAYLKIVILKMG